jgi:glutathione synthase
VKLGIVVNDIRTEEPEYTTTRLAIAAVNLEHEVWVMGVGDLEYDPDDRVRAQARRAPKSRYKALEVYLRELKSSKAIVERVPVDEFDVLLLRNDPASDAISRPWAATTGILFGRMAMRHGVIVLNDPNGLTKATTKMYFQSFPEEVRPKTLITRNREEIKAFAHSQGGTIVLKPLQGSGGQSVFLVRPEDASNLNQMIDAVSRDGYVIAQEYLHEAAEGDLRLFMMNGQPLRYKGKYAAFRRLRRGDDMRSNIHAGGTKAQAFVDDRVLRLAEIVRPKLVEDGMFLVGLDIVGDKLMEINVFSPGGLGSARSFEGVNFARGVIQALERKVQYMGFYQRNFNNVDMATL